MKTCNFKLMSREIQTLAFWRDVTAEFFATFFLVSVEVALPLTWGREYGGPVQTGLGMAFIVCTMAWTLGDFGGGHMNPAVTLGMMLAARVTLIRGIFYWMAQCLGGIAGAAFIYVVTPATYRDNLAATTLGPEVTVLQGMFMEAWITCILVITVLGSTNSQRKGDNVFMATIPIGFAIGIGLMTSFVATGGSMNPARSLGPAVMMGIWDDHWVYWAGPFIGSAIAVIVYVLSDKVDRPKRDSIDHDDASETTGCMGCCYSKPEVEVEHLNSVRYRQRIQPMQKEVPSWGAAPAYNTNLFRTGGSQLN